MSNTLLVCKEDPASRRFFSLLHWHEGSMAAFGLIQASLRTELVCSTHSPPLKPFAVSPTFVNISDVETLLVLIWLSTDPLQFILYVTCKAILQPLALTLVSCFCMVHAVQQGTLSHSMSALSAVMLRLVKHVQIKYPSRVLQDKRIIIIHFICCWYLCCGWLVE